ncbi:MAG: hypothetical protein ACTSR3_16645 [Candidatus Helarchaeota archaeon]
MKKSEKFSEIQKKILKLVLKGPIKQSELPEILNRNRTTIKYHIDRLFYDKLINKETILEVGGVKINEISINKLSLHMVRDILGIKSKGITLITGFGELGTGYKIPDISYKKVLEELKPNKIDKIICFTTPDALKIRKKKEEKEKLIHSEKIEFHVFNYLLYRNFDTEVFNRLEEILLKELEEYNVILDLTPLSKIFSFRLLEYSDQFNIASFYLGKDSKDKHFLIWFRK